jgi:predicted metal-dependent peptidase
MSSTAKSNETIIDKPLVVITKEDWLEMARQLEIHHSIFYKVWQMGKPVLTTHIPTAAVQFDKSGEFVMFYFNPEFWEKCTLYDRLFVVSHECLHVILNHGVRTRDSLDKKACNVALDIVVNHLLTRSFGFEREKISGWKELCWVDTVFKNKDGTIKTHKDGSKIRDDQSYEHYINLFERIEIPIGSMIGNDGNPVAGNGGKPNDDGGGLHTVDDHNTLGESAFEEVIDKLDEELSSEEKQSLKSMIEKHFPESETHKKAGKGTGGQWHFVETVKKKPKKKWETIIKKWSLKYISNEFKQKEQWARLNRRFQFLPSKLFLPSEMEFDDKEKDKNRIKVYFFLDTSGSCIGLKDRFFQAAETLPTEKFDVRLLCFDTQVKETTLASKKVYGGGGTSFRIMEEFIQKEKTTKEVPYPQAVFVITDGDGDQIVPEFPKNWHWFLTYDNSYAKSYCLPKETNIYNLKDFE